ncbi:hypothetical protein CDD81_7369 [Ophiocordyceps australis]|uniref:Small ribosomal subunit protein uS9m n=1 Tax=Ophiocordyceps australis TaxID=1399860 RepID=A0A2C5XY42_9HYPO|nr:hypothetical protein CDD81_7369 [Ophiocordyceps australis]
MASTLANSLRRRCLQAPRVSLAAWQASSPRMNMRQISQETLSTPIPDPRSIEIPFQGVSCARAVPVSPSYFSRETKFNDIFVNFTKLLAKYHHLPTLTVAEAPQVPWMKLRLLRVRLGEPIKAAQFAKFRRIAKRLNLIEPSLMPPEVKNAIKEVLRDINPFLNRPRQLVLDKFGRAVATGKRKESTARAFVVEGTGEVLVNGKPLHEAFGRVHDRESAIWALIATQRLDKYNVWALARGGGTTGQSEALALAVAKALAVHEPDLKPALRRAGCITRDPRGVERKKTGHVKARKMPAWRKR